MSGTLGPKVRIVTHYTVDDTEFRGDYTSVDIFVNEEKVCGFGDYMYDSGKQVAYGFVVALDYIFGKGNVDVTYENVADYEG